MNFYADTRKKNPNLTIRIHPLLLSLADKINMSETNPDISTISENDERATKSDLYTSPGAFPPLEIHFLGQDGPSLLSNKDDCSPLTSVAGCRECMVFPPQDNLAKKGDSNQGNSATIALAMEYDLAHMGSLSLGACNKGKKRRRASSGGHGVQGSLSNPRGPTVAGLLRRPKGKGARKAGSWDASALPKENSYKSSEEVKDRGVEPRRGMFANFSLQHLADDDTMLSNGTDDNVTLVEGLKTEIQALKSRCGALEKTVGDLQSICDTHQRTLETFRQHIINLEKVQGTLDLSYEGEEFEVIQ